jgi:hypothetical protein
MKIPKVKKLTDKQRIEILQKELVRKDKLIEELRQEKELLLKINIDKSKEQLELSSRK